MRKSLTLTEAAILARMAPAIVINERKRGNLPVVDSKSGGSLRLVDTLLLMSYGYLKQQTSSNREIGEQARAAANLACEAIVQYINGGLLEDAYFATIVSDGGNKVNFGIKSKEDYTELRSKALLTGSSIHVFPIERIVKEAMAAFDLCSIPSEEKVSDAVPATSITPLKLPDDLAVDHVKLERPHTGLQCGPEGLVAVRDGVGMMVRMSADNWRDLARRAETIADLLELRSQEVTQRQQPKSPSSSMPAPEEND